MGREIDLSCWAEFQVRELFDIHPTKAYKKTNIELFSKDGINPVIVNSSFNNGIGGFTLLDSTEKGGIITFSDTTSADSIFYQPVDFVGYPHIQGLYPIGEYAGDWNEVRMLFFATVLHVKATLAEVDYVNKFTRESCLGMKVMLPVRDGRIDWEFIDSFMEKVFRKEKKDVECFRSFDGIPSEIDTNSWEYFHLYDLFEILPGTKLDGSKMTEVNPSVAFVNRSGVNNGFERDVDLIDGIVPYDAGLMTLTLGGSLLGACFIQDKPFYTAQNVVVLKPKKSDITDYQKLFLACVITRESRLHYKAFEDELNRHIKRDFKFLLPVEAHHVPDWNYMHSYIGNKIDKYSRCINDFGDSAIFG